MYLFVIILIIFLIIFYNYYTNIETYVGNLKVATDLDRRKALKYALQQTCINKGYKWVELGDEMTFDCKYTKETCLKDSIYPTQENKLPQYYEWRDPSSNDAKKVVENTLNSSSKNISVNDTSQDTLSKKVGLSSLSQKEQDILDKDGICIIANETFRTFCEDNGLTYNPEDGSCVTNETYCLKRVLPFCNGDCYKPPGSWVSEAVLGTTLGRSIAAVNNYLTAGICKAANT
jgi:hypothetical protein